MAHIQVEFDAMKKVPAAARLACCTEAAFGWGLVSLWQFCWMEKTDLVGMDQLTGFFGEGVIGRALVAFGFADAEGAAFRVRGVEKYLRITTAKASAAKKTNAKRWGERQGSDSIAIATPSLPVALTPNTEHRTPNTLEEEAKVADATAAAPVAQLQAAWNDTADAALPRWKETGKARAALAKARLADRPSLEAWRAVIERINASAFCLGENDRGWRASPDWLLKPDTAARVLEGKYDGTGKRGRPPVEPGVTRYEPPPETQSYAPLPCPPCEMCGADSLMPVEGHPLCAAHARAAMRSGLAEPEERRGPDESISAWLTRNSKVGSYATRMREGVWVMAEASEAPNLPALESEEALPP